MTKETWNAEYQRLETDLKKIQKEIERLSKIGMEASDLYRKEERIGDLLSAMELNDPN